MHHKHKIPEHIRVPESPEYEEYYAIHEVYYDPIGYTKDPIDVVADTVEDLKDVLFKMAKAFSQPVLEYIDEDSTRGNESK